MLGTLVVPALEGKLEAEWAGGAQTCWPVTGILAIDFREDLLICEVSVEAALAVVSPLALADGCNSTTIGVGSAVPFS